MDLGRYEEWLLIYAKGFAMGCADAVPGVSGGTIALITGIYERLIHAITSVDPTSLVELAGALYPSEVDSFIDLLHEMDLPFLAVLGAGVLTALVLVLRLMHYLLQEAPVITYGFFFGLIAVSAIILYRSVDLSTNHRRLSALTGFLLAFLSSGYAVSNLGHGFPIIFLAGMVAVSAMVLPGISGSLILVIIGQYEYMSGALSQFIDAMISSIVKGEFAPVIEASPPVLIFVSGAFIGLFTVAHTVREALERYREATYAFLVSLVAGGLRAPVVQVGDILSGAGHTWIDFLPEFGFAALLGGLIVLVVDYKAGIIEY